MPVIEASSLHDNLLCLYIKENLAPFQGGSRGGRFPGLKPWAESCCPVGTKPQAEAHRPVETKPQAEPHRAVGTNRRPSLIVPSGQTQAEPHRPVGTNRGLSPAVPLGEDPGLSSVVASGQRLRAWFSSAYEFSATGGCFRNEDRINNPAAMQIQLSATLNEGQAYSRM
jgi:hypothetical protein